MEEPMDWKIVTVSQWIRLLKSQKSLGKNPKDAQENLKKDSNKNKYINYLGGLIICQDQC